MQEVELDSKIKLLDCPGIVFSNPQSTTSKNFVPAVLKNAQRVSDVKDPFTIAESILQRASKQYFCKLYDITEYDTYEEFFAKKASRMGIYFTPQLFLSFKSLTIFSNFKLLSNTFLFFFFFFQIF